MKTKKFLIGLLSLACVTAGSFGLAGCGTQGDQGVGIEKVEYDANGDLLITFTDGRTQTVAMPEKEGQSDGTEGLHYQRIAGKDEYRVIGLGIASEVDIVIPSTYNGLPVTEIADHAFGEQEYITSVIIPDSVTSIGYRAFSECSMTNVVIPDSVTSIGDEAFYYCSRLTSVVIGDSVTSIGNYAFHDCSSLTSVVIGDSVTSIGWGAFSSCSNLTSVVIGNSVTSIGEWVFQDCSSLTSIEIPDSVTSIGLYAFYYCSSLTSIQFKGTVAQWNAIEKVSSWNYKVPATEVVCSDGKAEL